MPQNWNNVLQYVKVHLGTKTSSLEITDEEFIEYLKSESLPYFSQIIPNIAWLTIDDGNLFYDNTLRSNFSYRINVPEGVELIDVNEAYIVNNIGSFVNSNMFGDPLDITIRAVRESIADHLRTVNDFHFIKPNIIRFSQQPVPSNIVLEVSIEHTKLETIPGDMYFKLFKPMCLLNAIEMVYNNRNKFTDLTTPFGRMELNTSDLQSKIQDLSQKIETIIQELPHRRYLEII